MMRRMLFWLIVLANIGGAVYGFAFYYGEQFLVTNPLLWVFVGDCPLYALLFGLAFFFRGEARPEMLEAWLGRVPDLSLLWFVAFVGAMKYGFWTVFVLTVFSGFYFTPASSLMYAVLFGAHIFMFFQTKLNSLM